MEARIVDQHILHAVNRFCHLVSTVEDEVVVPLLAFPADAPMCLDQRITGFVCVAGSANRVDL